jgi:TonB family protein
MNAPAPKASAWSGGRFLLLAAALFAAQAAAVMLLAERTTRLSVPPSQRMAFRLVGGSMDGETLSKYIFAGNPAIFPASSPHAFADQAWQAWLRLLPAKYQFPEPAEPETFLGFAAGRIGLELPPAAPAPHDVPFSVAEPTEPLEEAAPNLTFLPAIQPDSYFHIEGPLAARQIAAPTALQTWATDNVLSNTIVEFAVNRAGQVIVARLVRSSGRAEADASAVNSVSALRFVPGKAIQSEPVWDRAAFFWKSVPMVAATNAPVPP